MHRQDGRHAAFGETIHPEAELALHLAEVQIDVHGTLESMLAERLAQSRDVAFTARQPVLWQVILAVSDQPGVARDVVREHFRHPQRYRSLSPREIRDVHVFYGLSVRADGLVGLAQAHRLFRFRLIGKVLKVGQLQRAEPYLLLTPGAISALLIQRIRNWTRDP